MKKDDKFGAFTIQGVVSTKSGFADIYEAKYEKDGSTVALKVLKPTKDPVMLHLFKNETKILEELKADKNPHIVEIKDSGNVGEQHFIAMEKLGAPLFDVIPFKPMAPENATDYIIQVCEALIPVHNRGYVHHDVQVNNVLSAGDGRYKLIDFGIAYAAGEPKVSQVLGLDKILSPEQREKTRDDPRSDQYNVGLLYHFLLTSREFIKHLTEEPNLEKFNVNPPQVMVDVLKKMLRKKPEDRYVSIDEPLSILKKAIGR